MQFQIEQAEALLKKAALQGASDGDIVVAEGDSFSTQVRLDDVEKISSACGKRLGLRLFFGKRSAISSTSDLSAASLERLLFDTCEMAKMAEEDPAAGLPSPEACAHTFPELDAVDSEIGSLSIEEKIGVARQAERAALKTDIRLNNSEGADFSHAFNERLYVASNGFGGLFKGSLATLSVMPIATEAGKMQRDYWYSSRRKFKQLETAELVGRRAAMRTLRRIGAKKVSTQEVPVVFEPEVAGSLLGHLASAISGYALYKGASFLFDMLGHPIASSNFNLYDDPTLPQGLGSRPFDGEGLPSTKKTIVEKGILKNYLLDTYSGEKLGLPSNGSAVRGTGSPPSAGPSNFQMMPGDHLPEEIIRSVRSGFYVTELIGFGVNMITGDYSRGASGIWIENGELAHPVEELTIAGNLKDIYKQIELIGNDIDPSKTLAAPTLKIAKMMVAGN
ncbi:MAG: TldD/PmbA family protein [Nitrospiria bacterium]